MNATVRPKVGCASRASTLLYWRSSSRLENVAWIALWQSRQMVVVTFSSARFGHHVVIARVVVRPLAERARVG